MTEDCLTVQYRSKLRSIDLMDSFERCNEQQEPLYNKLLLQDVFTVLIDEISYQADILIARKPYEMPCCFDSFHSFLTSLLYSNFIIFEQ